MMPLNPGSGGYCRVHSTPAHPTQAGYGRRPRLVETADQTGAARVATLRCPSGKEKEAQLNTKGGSTPRRPLQPTTSPRPSLRSDEWSPSLEQVVAFTGIRTPVHMTRTSGAWSGAAHPVWIG